MKLLKYAQGRQKPPTRPTPAPSGLPQLKVLFFLFFLVGLHSWSDSKFFFEN